MFLKRLFTFLLLGLGLTSSLSGCLSAPTYPVEPSIDFEKMPVVRRAPTKDLPSATDTFKIVINFRDGDGDLGVSDKETKVPPYSDNNSDGSPNLNKQFNYYLRVFRRVPPSTQFKEVFPGQEFSNFPVLNEKVIAKPAPLKGELVFKRFYDVGSPFNPGDEAKFTVSIKDRALHESNTVESSVYVVKPR